MPPGIYSRVIVPRPLRSSSLEWKIIFAIRSYELTRYFDGAPLLLLRSLDLEKFSLGPLIFIYTFIYVCVCIKNIYELLMYMN